jgi:hypothetical protein
MISIELFIAEERVLLGNSKQKKLSLRKQGFVFRKKKNRIAGER